MKNKIKNIRLVSAVLTLGSLLATSCTKYDLNPKYDTSAPVSTPQRPTVTTTAITNIDTTSAISGGHITNTATVTITAKGVCWSTHTTPTISDSITNDGTGSGPFTSHLTGLTHATKYYVRAYATDSIGTVYGNELSLTTLALPGPTATDIDGNIYPTVDIGTQTWMASNLKVTKYQNGNLIGTTNPVYQDISGETAPAYEWAYDGSSSNVPDYGLLYTWFAVTDSQKVCPVGWHVPTGAEWNTLINYLGGDLVAGSKLKESGNDHWGTLNTDATNESGFTARPGGFRPDVGTFNGIGSYGLWWTADQNGTDGKYIQLYSGSTDALMGFSPKGYGAAVRCIKD